MVIKKTILLLVLFFCFIFLSSAYSGVSPGTYTMDFEPGADRVFTFTFLGDVDSNYEVYSDGDLAKYATLNVDELSGGGTVNVLLELPENIDPPGAHVLYVGAREQAANNGISVTANVQGQIIVNVPYPGKYAKMYFNVKNANVGEDVNMQIKLDNLGSEDVNFEGKINIYDDRGKLIKSIGLGDYPVKSRNSETVEYALDTTSYPPGKYKAEAEFDYESGLLVEESPFRIGELMINIVDATRKMEKNSINRFDISIESLWNDPIDNVHAEVNVFGQNIKFTTPSVRLESFAKANLTGFFDTTGIEDESFNVNVRVFYEGRFTEKFVKLSYKNETNYLLIIIIAVAAIFLIVIILLVVITIKLRRIKNEITRKKK